MHSSVSHTKTSAPASAQAQKTKGKPTVQLRRFDTASAEQQPVAARRTWPDRLVRAGWVLLVILMVGTAPIALNRGINDMGGTDFPEYYEAGRYLLEHHAIQPHAMTAYYLPSVDVFWAGIALFPVPVAAVLWYVIGCLAWFGLLRALSKYMLFDLPNDARQQAVIAVGLLVAPLVLDQLCIGAFHGIMLWWMVAGLGRIVNGKRWTGAALLGLAIWIKLLPAIGAAYLLYKRRWREAILAGCVALLVDIGLTSLVLPYAANVQAHLDWLHRDAVGTAELLLASPDKVNEQRVTNQSMPAVLRRILTELGYPSNSSRDLASLANLTSTQLKTVYYSVLGLVGVGILWICRRSASQTPVADQAMEVALIVLSTLWFTPIAPSYHPIAVAPALALIIGRHSMRPLAWGAVALWVLAMGLHGVPVARAFGHVLWITFILAAFLLRKAPRLNGEVPANRTVALAV